MLKVMATDTTIGARGAYEGTAPRESDPEGVAEELRVADEEVARLVVTVVLELGVPVQLGAPVVDEDAVPV